MLRSGPSLRAASAAAAESARTETQSRAMRRSSPDVDGLALDVKVHEEGDYLGGDEALSGVHFDPRPRVKRLYKAPLVHLPPKKKRVRERSRVAKGVFEGRGVGGGKEAVANRTMPKMGAFGK